VPDPAPAMAPSGAEGPWQLGPYRLVRKLRAGGMGVVYEAWHTKLQRRVALKTLRPGGAPDDYLVARFHREMAVVGGLDHPNIVRASDADEIDGCHFLIMDFVDGLDLGEVVRRQGPLPVADACEAVRQGALGLQHAHERGLVHRDVKPSNLMVARGGEIKLLDLGLALLPGRPAPGEQLRETGQRLGTVDYMAPEQARDAHRVDARADLYGLGCTLFKLLIGEPPYGEPDYESVTAKLWAHERAPIPSAHALRPE